MQNQEEMCILYLLLYPPQLRIQEFRLLYRSNPVSSVKSIQYVLFRVAAVDEV